MNPASKSVPIITLKAFGVTATDASLNIKGPSPVPSLGAIGSFDGFHQGHKAIVAKAKEMAQAQGLALSLVTFDPHPISILAPAKTPFRLMSLNQQIKAAIDLGVDQILVLNFDTNMSNISPEVFLQSALKERLGLKGLVYGFDFRFGAKGAGTAAYLREWADQNDFLTCEIEPQLSPDGQKWSSSLARSALISGDTKLAHMILGRHFEIEGIVQKGRQLGRQLGFPTLNIDTGYYQVPKHGTYITRTKLPSGHNLPSISNLGFRPTVDGKNLSFETHIFDFCENLYGQKVSVEFHDYLRGEIAFSDLEALKAQIANDCILAQEFHRRAKSSDLDL
jgi:riboflavin kinase / FMN adenylyltransferase